MSEINDLIEEYENLPEPIAGEFDPNNDLMWQLEKLKTQELAKKWWEQYKSYHGRTDTGIFYAIGYFADREHQDNLRKWFI